MQDETQVKITSAIRQKGNARADKEQITKRATHDSDILNPAHISEPKDNQNLTGIVNSSTPIIPIFNRSVPANITTKLHNERK